MRQALYRAHRPHSFDEVMGQEHITTVLQNELRENRPSHAYLFIGSRGTGKTTCALILAKALNCLNLQDGNPCNACAFCKAADEGTLLDISEIDAASNNGVDHIRELREEAIFTPTQANYRVYIIDEVHMLSSSAFNALLKILEEPPAHVVFILATTEIHKVLPTIISRCQRFDFHRITPDVIAQRLHLVAERESIQLSEDGAQLIARLAEGGMRDALSLLDVCAAHAQQVTGETVAKAAGLAGSDHLLALCEAILSQDCSAMLSTVSDLLQKSLEPQRLCEQLIGHYRNLMLIKTLPDPLPLLGCLPAEADRLKVQATKIKLAEVMQSLTLLQEASTRMAKSLQKRAELELALLTLTEPSARSDSGALAARVEKLEGLVQKLLTGQMAISAAGASGGSEAAASASSRAATGSSSVVPPQRQSTPFAQEELPPSSAQRQTRVTPSAVPEAVNEIKPFAQWQSVLSQLEISNKALFSMLSGTKAFFDGRRVLIDIQNTVLLQMLKTNEYTKTTIKQAILMATGSAYGLGPYTASPQKVEVQDPLEDLIASLPQDSSIRIQ